MTEPEETWLTTGETARMFGVDPKTITRWDKAGILRNNGVRVRRTPGGHRQFLKFTVEEYLARLENEE